MQADGLAWSHGRTGNTVVRVFKDGRRDPSFGTAGETTLPLGGLTGVGWNVGVASADGRVMLAGFNNVGDLGIWRLFTTGVVDAAFGIGGFATTDLDEHNNQILDIRVDDKQTFHALSKLFSYDTYREYPRITACDSQGGIDDAYAAAADFTTTDSFEQVLAGALQDDHVAVIAGYDAGESSTPRMLTLRRYWF
jgi:hypothetical protein